MPLHVSSTCAHHQEVKIALHSLWYHHTYRCDDTRGCVMQFWPPDDEHMCSKHIEAWNKLIVKQKVCASIWLVTEINILRCTVSKTSKLKLVLNSVSRCITYITNISILNKIFKKLEYMFIKSITSSCQIWFIYVCSHYRHSLVVFSVVEMLAHIFLPLYESQHSQLFITP